MLPNNLDSKIRILADEASRSRRINHEKDPRSAVQRVLNAHNIPIDHDSDNGIYRLVLKELSRRARIVKKRNQVQGKIHQGTPREVQGLLFSEMFMRVCR